MGLGFVLFFWIGVGSLFAAIGLISMGCSVAYLTRGVPEGRRRVIICAGLFPFACLAWAVAWFLFQAWVNERYFDRDPGMGDVWECPLPNGYHVVMIDVTDEGSVYNPKTQKFHGNVVSQDDAVFGVRTLQVSGPYLLGGVDTKFADHFANQNKTVDSYFVLDCRTGKKKVLLSEELLRDSARQLGITLELRPIELVYDEFRGTWFDRVAIAILFSPPSICLGLLIWWIVRIRRTRVPILRPV